MAIYLDYNATTPVDSSVCTAISTALSEVWGNPSSLYRRGTEARKIIHESRIEVSNMIRCRAEEIIFTSGGTESNNMVIHTAVKHFNSDETKCDSKPHVITSNIEHDSVRLCLENLSDSNKIDVTFVPVSLATGSIRVEDVMKAIRPNTCLITIMMANNETGVIQPISQLGQRLRKQKSKILFHTDAAQAIGKIQVDVPELKVDYLTIVGHKFYGPRIGALYCREGRPLYPLFYGGGQERNYRPGTENTCMIYGLGKACNLVSCELDSFHSTMNCVRKYLEQCLKKEFGDKVIFHVKPNVKKLPNTLSVAFNYDGISGRHILAEANEICASTGAACHSGRTDSSVLECSGVSRYLVDKTLRLSVGRETKHCDIERAVKSLKHAIEKLNELPE